MSLRTRSVLALAALWLATMLPAAAPSVVSAADLTISQAESRMLSLINADRTAAGLVPLRTDSRLMAIARARSQDMATYHYFAHTQPDGRTAIDYLSAAHVTWYVEGEIIAYNTGYPTLADSANVANSGWMASSGHKAIIMSTNENYFGIGLAIDSSNGRRIWTGVFIKGPDRTGAWARMGAKQTPGARTSSGTRRINISWSGNDYKLQVLTAGFYSYQVQRRTDLGSWVTLYSSTTGTHTYRYQKVGHRYDFRVRARDRVGNYGSWSAYISFSI
jgi:uncharacterized protein YkwD